MPKTYLHIGYPKCASTYLQDEIFPQLGNYSHIVRAPNEQKYYPFNRNFDQETFRQYVENHIQNPDPSKNHLLVSFEDWCELLFQEFADVLCTFRNLDRKIYDFSNERVLENLKKAYPDAHIIIIIREQISWINSRYKMLYRGAKIFKPVEECLRNPLNGYDHLIATAQKLFGKDQVSVIPFELIKQDQKAFVENIARLIDPHQPVEVSTKRVNRAPTLERTVQFSRIKTRIRKRLDAYQLRLFYPFAKALLILFLKPALWFLHRNNTCKDPATKTDPATLEIIRQSNRRVNELTGLHLEDFGYQA